MKTIIDCDAIYPDKRYELQLIQISARDLDCDSNNYIFKLIDKHNSTEIIRDSIFSFTKEVRFEDFNGDNIKDILIRNKSDVRSNESYYLYLVDTAQNKLTKVEGFEQIKNPAFNPDLNIIVSFAVSGRDWTSFYEIQDNAIVDLGYLIYWDEVDENGNMKDPENDYEEVLNQIMKARNSR
ncbi:XAC2610-related protein [Bacteroides sp. 224]|uniref:XAC2610-related protein n=1 Tax=Bacteroides sp. 224 TaxID=2302936 RepID=UPI0013D3E3FC|nr:hypothetical protein [Bacteroides sp. 224]NDV66714.1 hypothetical protein [Bacteroides sp. 224]